LSSDGRFKRLPIEDFQELSGRAASVLKLKDGVTLQRVVLCREGEELVVGSSTGRLLRLAVNEANLPVMGRNAQGPVLLQGCLKVISCRAHGHASKSEHSPDVVAQLLLACVH